MSAAVSQLYTVAVGDSLTKLATRFYGDPAKYTLIAQSNALQPTQILLIGQRLKIPAAPGLTPDTQVDTSIVVPTAQLGPEEVIVTASVWYKDWRYWVALGLGGAVLVYFVKKGMKR